MVKKNLFVFFCLCCCFFVPCLSQQLSLSDCIDYALKNRYDLKSYNIEDGIRRLDVKTQKYRFSPSVSANINNGLSQGYQQVFTEDAAGIYQSVQSYNNSASVNFSMPIWSAEAQMALVEVGELNRQLNLTEKRAQEFAIRLDIISCYYSLLVAQERYNVAKNNYVSQDSVVNNTATLYEIGKSSKSDLLDARTNLMQYKQDMLAQSYEVAKAEAALVEIIQYEKDDIEILPVDSLPLLPDFDELYDAVLDRFPALIAKRTEINAIETENKTYRRQLYPSIYFNYEVGTSSQFLQDQPNRPIEDQWGGNFHQNANISISIPIFSQMGVRTNIRKNELSMQSVENEAARLRRQLYDDLRTIYIELAYTYELYGLANETEQMSGEQVVFAAHSYALGLLPSYELEIYKQKHTTARMQAIQTKYEWLYKMALIHEYMNLSDNGYRL